MIRSTRLALLACVLSSPALAACEDDPDDHGRQGIIFNRYDDDEEPTDAGTDADVDPDPDEDAGQ